MRLTIFFSKGPDNLVHHVVEESTAARRNVVACTALTTDVRRAAHKAWEYVEWGPTCFRCMALVEVFGEALR